MINNYSTVSPNQQKLTATTARAPFGYFGAKLRIVSKLVELLPPHNAWVEAFCGSAALTLAKRAAPIEIINDLDNQVVNLFKQLRENHDELCRSIALTPYSRAEFYKSREFDESLDSLEKARRFLICTMMTVNATYGKNNGGFSFSHSYSRNGKEARVSRWYNLPDRISKVVERLRNIRIENRDARELVDMFSKRPATLIYLDPPYFTKRQHKYVIDANDENFHRELLSICCKSKSMIIISGYNNDLYNSILLDKGWVSDSVQTSTRDTNGIDYNRTEMLWMNHQFKKAAKTGRVPIRLSKKEKISKKINPLRK
ncbi:MAG: DNA adenine methylase [Candidatus Electryonea clarkiae]|nr:DNA adenine methylase [Candidatus Electryonea clarkiae]MDP8287632.1 DNA adenine methylase [Candidatus Electryonea clarkiae]